EIIVSDIAEINGAIRTTICADDEYDVFTLDQNLKIIKSVKTLAKAGSGFGSGVVVYDSNAKSLFHMIDIAGPIKNSFCQFMRTDVDGKSCQYYDTPPFTLTLSAFEPGIVHAQMKVQEVAYTATSLTWTKTTETVSTAAECGK